MDSMGVSIYYRGQLDAEKTVDELIEYVEEFASERNLRCQQPHELFMGDTFEFNIPHHIIDAPDKVIWISNEERIKNYASEAGLDTNMSYRELCHELNSLELKQVGVYIWLHENAEPLRFIFVEGDSRLTQLKADSINIGRSGEALQYVSFYRDSLATNTAYEHDPQAHQDALDLLHDIGQKYFGGTLEIKDYDEAWYFVTS